MEKIFYNKQGYDDAMKMLEDSAEWQRFNFHSNKIYTISYGHMKETDTHVYFSMCALKPMFNKKLFFKRKTLEGVTYNKETRELKVWFDKQFYTLTTYMQSEIVNHFKVEWFDAMPWTLKNMATNTLIKRVIEKKITNPKDYTKAFLRTYFPKTTEISHHKFYNLFRENSHLQSPRAYFEKMIHCTDPNDYINLMCSGADFEYSSDYVLLNEMMQQAKILDEKINIKWSDARMKEVHNEWTKRIMELEVKNIQPIEYNYPEGLDTIPELELITNNIDLFTEGKTMNHCVYSSYNSGVKNKDYFVLKYDDGNVRGTVGVSFYYDLFAGSKNNSNTVYVQQFHGKYNCSMPDDVCKKVDNWIKQKHVQDWFLKTKHVKTTVAEEIILEGL